MAVAESRAGWATQCGGRDAAVSPVSGLSPAVAAASRARGEGCRGERRLPKIEEVRVAAGPMAVSGTAGW
jgi:hypothetical protein